MKQQDAQKMAKRARSLLIVVPTPTTKDYEIFAETVSEYTKKYPFNFTMPSIFSENEWKKVCRLGCL